MGMAHIAIDFRAFPDISSMTHIERVKMLQFIIPKLSDRATCGGIVINQFISNYYGPTIGVMFQNLKISTYFANR